MNRFLYLLPILFVLVGCRGDDSDLITPTLTNPDLAKTELAKTPAPPGFEVVHFDPIDLNRDLLPSWHFQVVVEFTGQYTNTGEDAASRLTMDVWENSVNRTRRVLLDFSGQALSGNLSTRVEAARFENDFYIIDSSGICTQNNDAAREIANLDAGEVLGGVTVALPSGLAMDINGYQGFQYLFAEENLTLDIFRETPSALNPTGGEIWVLPEYNVVGRFGVALDLHNARILFGEEPVTGTLRYTYDLLEIGGDIQIALPNGC
jgi:hypothetical protein